MMPDKRPGPSRAGRGARQPASRRPRGPSVGIVVLATLAAPLHAGFAAAEIPAATVQLAQRVEPRISVSPTIIAEPASQTSLSIQIGPANALPSNSFVRIRGLPASVSLTEGHAIGPGSWAIPLFGVAALKANVPAGVSGRSEIVISLVAVDGSLLAEVHSALVVGSAAMLAPQDKSPLEPSKRASPLTPPAPIPAGRPERQNQQAPRAPELSAEAKAGAEKLMSQGQRYLEQGNVEIARQFFRRAADAGFAPAAIRLASTYDPGELTRLQVQGVVPDRAEARKWYERARELGAPEAEERLARLGGS